ncbi:MAG: hypothetical protein K6C41_04290 [Lachnospiraceae bacterium]|nr:hypothetical protein [Lachnospiraceae bacterium]
MKTEKSEIELVIEEIEDYLDTCKSAPLSQTKIVVNRDDIDSLIEELKTKTPAEIRKYQKIISNQDAILQDARRKADAIIEEAHLQTNKLVSEHVIMNEAYKRANDVVDVATKQATEMLNKATLEANDIRTSAIEYTDNLLKNVQDIIVASMDSTKIRTDRFLEEMQGYLDTVTGNRLELSPDPAKTVMNSTMPNRVQKPDPKQVTGISVASAMSSRHRQAAPAATEGKTADKGSAAVSPAQNAVAQNAQQSNVNSAVNEENTAASLDTVKPADNKARNGVDVPEQFFNKD